MDKKSKELTAAAGLILGLGLAIGPAIIANYSYNQAATEVSSPAAAESLRHIGDISYDIDLGGVALAAVSGVALRRFENQSD